MFSFLGPVFKNVVGDVLGNVFGGNSNTGVVPPNYGTPPPPPPKSSNDMLIPIILGVAVLFLGFVLIFKK